MKVLAPLIVAALLAGCGAPESTTLTAPLETTTGPAAGNVTKPIDMPSRVQLGDCEQMHGFFPVPVELLRGAEPNGFTIITSNGGTTTDVFVGWQFCDGGNVTHQGAWTQFERGASFLAALLVESPVPGDEVTLDLVTLTWHEAVDPVAAWLADWNVTYSTYAPVALSGAGSGLGTTSRTYVTNPPFGTFQQDTQIADGATPNDATTYRVWQVDETDAIRGYVQIDNAPCQTIGMGQAALTFVGSGVENIAGAPPLNVGLAHMVDDCDVTYTFVATDV